MFVFFEHLSIGNTREAGRCHQSSLCLHSRVRQRKGRRDNFMAKTWQKLQPDLRDIYHTFFLAYVYFWHYLRCCAPQLYIDVLIDFAYTVVKCGCQRGVLRWKLK